MSDADEPGLRWTGVGQVVERWLEVERDQLALWVPVGLGAGISAWFLLPDPATWMGWCCLCLAVALCAAMLAQGSRLRAVLIGAGLLAAAGCMIVWAKAQLTGTTPLARPLFAELRAEVLSVEPLPAQSSTRLIMRPIDRPDLPGGFRITVADDDAPKGMGNGAVLSYRVRLMPPAEPAVPGAYDFAARAYFMGIGATGRALTPIRVEKAADASSLSIRERLSRHIQDRLPQAEGAIAATLATGDRGAISEDDAEAMRRSGLAHLLSISGLHVTALVGAVMLLVYRLLALSTRLALRWPLTLVSAGAGAAAAVGYTILSGGDVPTVRSCVAALLVLGGLALGRDALTLRLVAAGALVVLFFWPESLMGPSFQMSFAAVTTIVALGEHPRVRALLSARDEAWPFKIGRGLVSLFIVGIAVEAVLAPIALFHFHQTGVLGALANMVAIPLTTFVIMPFEAAALLLDVAGLGWPAWWVTGKAIGLLLAVAHGAAAMPGAVALTPAFPGSAFALVITGGLWCMLWRTSVRWAGLIPVTIGFVIILTTPRPDVLVTGDGRHVVVRTDDGGLALLRDRAGDYVRDTLSESAGFDGPLQALAEMPGARCSIDLCAVPIRAARREYRLLATRSNMIVPAEALARDCATADIVVSDRRLPRTCVPAWLKIDRSTLRRTGGVALYLDQREMRTVRKPGDAHPWIMQPRPKRVQ